MVQVRGASDDAGATAERRHDMATMEGVQVVSLSLGYVMGQALRAAATLGVADALADGSRTSDEIARLTDCHAPSMARLLRTLAAGGIVIEEDDGRFALTTLGDTLRSDAPDSVRAAVVWVGEPMHYVTCGELAETVRTGEPAFARIFGQGYFQRLATHPDAGRVWDEGMACFSAMENDPIARVCPFAPGAHVVDVGGGNGGFLAAVLRRHASLRGTLFDRSEVVAHPLDLERAGVLDRCELVAGDFFDTVPAGRDVYVLKRVLHDWDDETCGALLRRCRDAMTPGGRVLIIDAVIPPGNDPHPAKIVDLVMMSILSGHERTADEFGALCAAAGLRLTRVIPTESMLAVVEAVPA
jgi:hypothetical protein